MLQSLGAAGYPTKVSGSTGATPPAETSGCRSSAGGQAAADADACLFRAPDDASIVSTLC